MSGALGTRLRPASYRGARFYVEEAGGTFGRRFADHEYPARDTPFAEDLGRAQRTWSLTGYTIGPQFRAARDRLIAACERPGVGELMHPALGIVQAVCRTIQVGEQREAGLRSVFSLEFAEPGELQEPADDANTAMQIEGAADALGIDAAAALVADFDVTATLDYVADYASADVLGLADMLDRMRLPASGYPQSPVVEAIGVLRADAPALVQRPQRLADAAAAAFAAFSNGGEPGGIGLAMLDIADGYIAGASPFATASAAAQPRINARSHVARNRAAWQAFCRELALRELGYLTPALPVDHDADAVALERRLVAAFDAVETSAADAGRDDVFLALIRLRAAMLRDIARRRAGAAPLVIYQTERSQPSLVLAWRFYRNAARDDELVRATACITPAFMPRTGRVRAA